MPQALEVPHGVFKDAVGKWQRNCPVCLTTITHLRRNYCIGAHNTAQPCKRCSNINNHPSGLIGAVRLSWYESFRKSAITRGYCWEISAQEVDALYEQQKGLCALSGLPIHWSTIGWDHTASIDRINNDVGYVIENIQLVHKKINMMRGTLDIEEFVYLCSAVSDKEKW